MPAYHPPRIETPPAFREASAAPSPATAVPVDWWTGFGDPALDSLEARIPANPRLAEALARYDAARASLAEAKAARAPTIDATARTMENRLSDGRPMRGPFPLRYADDSLGAALSYHPDLWGRVRAGVAAGRAEASAGAEDVAAVRLSLQAMLADTYLVLRGQDERIALLSRTVDAFTRADGLTQRRHEGGIASGLDTGRAGTQLEEARALLAQARLDRAVAEHAVAALVGASASAFTLPVGSLPVRMPTLAPGTPAAMLASRPDVAAAERRMAAANARVGLARTAFFPDVALDAQAGLQSGGIARLLRASNLFWSIGPAAVLNLFDGGRRRAGVARATAEWNRTAADYRATVLDACREVEDALAAERQLAEAGAAERRAADEAETVDALALDRYVKGAVTYLDVATAQSAALRVRQSAIELSVRRLQAGVALARALGGGLPAQG